MQSPHNSPYQSEDIINERYRIIGILGQGGTAITYEAEDITLNKSVAVKVLSLHQSQEWKVIELFEREAKVLANLHHPRIPKYYDYFYLDLEQDRHFFIVQELIVGNSLKTLVDKGWYFQENEVKEIAKQVLEILNYLHGLKPSVIHRDIKPHNLIKTDAGEIYLVDFGSVQDVYRNTITRGATFVGTIDYMSPEQIRGQTSFASDLYSLGCTLLYLLTKRSPSELPLERMKINFRQKLKLSESFADWLDTILEPVPEDRFQSTAEALSKLDGEIIEHDDSLIPVRWSNIEIRRNKKSLQIKVPPAGLFSKQALTCIAPLLIIIPVSFVMYLGFRNDPDVPDFFLSVYPITTSCFIIFPLFIKLLVISCCEILFKVEREVFLIRWQIGKISRQRKLLTKYIDRIGIKQKEIRRKNTISIEYFIVIHEGVKKYEIGKDITLREKEWLLKVIADFIDYLYPGTQIPTGNKNSFWFNN